MAEAAGICEGNCTGNATAAPLVSCVMPTRNRRRLAAQAIWYFLRQDYAARELIILDDGEDAIADIVPNDERIRYVRLERTLSVGAKRNLGCELCRGELIAHWDDDDWMAPDRLSLQVNSLLAAGADVCGLANVLHYHLDRGRAWIYRSPSGNRPWLAGGTLLYRRPAWAAHRFPEINVGEDRAFLGQLPVHRLQPLSNPSFYVAIIHSGNSNRRPTTGPGWSERPLDEVRQVLGDDRQFYASWRNRHVSPPRAAAGPAPSITVVAPITVSTGYGSMAEYLIVGLARAGATVDVMPLVLNLAGATPELQDIVRRSGQSSHKRVLAAPGAATLYFHALGPQLDRFRSGRDLFIYTAWESSRLPALWAKQMNGARAVMVPSRFVARVCRESGVAVPVVVINQGIDPEVYHYEKRPRRETFTVLMVGPVDPRKHTREGIEAWKQAFAGDPSARLIIKTNYSYHNYTPDDPRIRYIDRDEPTRGIVHWYRQADVLLALGNEGFGLPLVEGMATGLPVIVLNSEAQADIVEEAGDCLLPVEPARWERDERSPHGPAGLRGVPGVEEVVARLRWVASHRDEAQAMGRAASAWAVANRNAWTQGPAVLEVMEQHVRPQRALRRIRTLWVPTWQTPCGIAEYTAHLVEAMKLVRATAQFPEVQGMRLLHVQHEHSIYHDEELLRGVRRARAANVPVVITEHSVHPGAKAWEREADALVALTRRGADSLRTRWPGKRVDHLPPGCPTWFPPRKIRRGQVIGAFGFLERHKGFWRLLDALAALPGTEALLFSYAKQPEHAAEWEAAARGLPVRRCIEFLPVAEIARRLAAEADILVFWYDDISHAEASYAVRVGLATGVPVLASPTAWFSDLSAVTYQPGDLVEGIRRLLDDTPLRERLVAAARDYCHDHSWERIAERHLALWQTLESR